MPATFWLFWQMMRDRSLLVRAMSEVSDCRTTHITESLSFDALKLCNQPLLQSCYAESLRMYVAVNIIRKPEYEDAQVLDYSIPKDKIIVVSSAMVHMDKRKWKLGMMNEHMVEEFRADRFLTLGCNTTPASSASAAGRDRSTLDSPASKSPLAAVSSFNPREPKCSLNGHSRAQILFSDGIHQCPGRHWVKLQMLLSFAIISSAFDIELVSEKKRLQVDMAKYGLGVLQPAEKVRFRIKRIGRC